MRKPQNKNNSIDFSKPLNLEDVIISSDCFGNLWEPTTNECSMCSDFNVCAFVFKQNKNEPLKKTAKLTKEIASEYSFDVVRNSQLITKIKNNSGKFKRSQLFEAVETMANCKDAILINDFIDGLLLEHGLKVHSGYIVNK